MGVEGDRVVERAEYAVPHDELAALAEVHRVLAALDVDVLQNRVFKRADLYAERAAPQIEQLEIADDQIADVEERQMRAQAGHHVARGLVLVGRLHAVCDQMQAGDRDVLIVFALVGAPVDEHIALMLRAIRTQRAAHIHARAEAQRHVVAQADGLAQVVHAGHVDHNVAAAVDDGLKGGAVLVGGVFRQEAEIGGVHRMRRKGKIKHGKSPPIIYDWRKSL